MNKTPLTPHETATRAGKNRARLKDTPPDIRTFYLKYSACANFYINGFLSVIKIKYTNDNVKNVLSFAAHNGHLSVVERLLQIPRVSLTIGNNINPLLMAAMNGRFAVVDRLHGRFDVPVICMNNIRLFVE